MKKISVILLALAITPAGISSGQIPVSTAGTVTAPPPPMTTPSSTLPTPKTSAEATIKVEMLMQEISSFESSPAYRQYLQLKGELLSAQSTASLMRQEEDRKAQLAADKARRDKMHGVNTPAMTPSK